MKKHLNLLKALCLLPVITLLSACITSTVNVDGGGIIPPKKNTTGPVTIEGNCEQRSIDGYRDKIKISVKDNVVSKLDWTASPRAGSCRFESKNFTQVSDRPNADLVSKKDKKCHVYVWQDERHVTVAIYGCKKICKQNDRILPVLLEPQTGACKPAGNDNNIATK